MATSHGKGACDYLGETVKRLAARASLQRPYNYQLMTPRQLFDWACTNIPAAYFGYCSSEGYAREQSSLERRFQLSRTIPGTRKLHSFAPISNSTVEVRPYSASDTSRKESHFSEEWYSTRIDCWLCHLFVRWELVAGLCTWSLQ